MAWSAMRETRKDGSYLSLLLKVYGHRASLLGRGKTEQIHNKLLYVIIPAICRVIPDFLRCLWLFPLPPPLGMVCAWS